MGSHGPLDNANPLVREREQVRRGSRDAEATKAGPLDAEAWWTWGLETEGEGGVEDAASAREPIDAIEVFEHIRDIADPEHPYSLEQLGVVSASHIEVGRATRALALHVVLRACLPYRSHQLRSSLLRRTRLAKAYARILSLSLFATRRCARQVDDAGSTVIVKFTPTVAHCSMATLIGLCIRTKIMRVLPARFKVRGPAPSASLDPERAAASAHTIPARWRRLSLCAFSTCQPFPLPLLGAGACGLD